jgi:predicted RNase H-like HicB family nuclease
MAWPGRSTVVHVLLEWDPAADAWVTDVPTLNGLSTFGETKEEALTNAREAILGYLEAAVEYVAGRS